VDAVVKEDVSVCILSVVAFLTISTHHLCALWGYVDAYISLSLISVFISNIFIVLLSPSHLPIPCYLQYNICGTDALLCSSLISVLPTQRSPAPSHRQSLLIRRLGRPRHSAIHPDGDLNLEALGGQPLRRS
jgi:hypothetical protein